MRTESTPATQLLAQELFSHGRTPIHINCPLHIGNTPLHGHDFYEIALVDAGRALHRDVHGLTPVDVHSVILVQPGQWHAYEECRGLKLTNTNFGRYLLHHELAWAVQDGHLATLVAPRSGIRILKANATELSNLRRQINALHDLLEQQDQRRVSLVGQLLLVLDAMASLLSSHGQANVDHRVPDVVRQVLRAIEQDLAREWTLHELADLADIDASYLSRLMHRHMGISPIAWLNHRRLERAAVLLLTTDEPIGAIAQQVGMQDQNYFARRFRTMFAQTPSAYRQQLPLPANAPVGDDWIQW